MNDRELLELAAKAAGHLLGPEWNCYSSGIWINGNGRGDGFLWNPLTDDGDALRLAIDLQMEMMLRLDSDSVMTYFEVGHNGLNVAERPSEHGGDVHAAVRMAFVRSAAEIGKAMP